MAVRPFCAPWACFYIISGAGVVSGTPHPAVLSSPPRRYSCIYWKICDEPGEQIVQETLHNVHCSHSRRIKTEEKAKVVAAAWGAELIQFLAALAVLHQDDLKKRINKIKAAWRNVLERELQIP